MLTTARPSCCTSFKQVTSFGNRCKIIVRPSVISKMLLLQHSVHNCYIYKQFGSTKCKKFSFFTVMYTDDVIVDS